MKIVILIIILISFKLSFAQSGWFWQNPKPQGSNLTDAVFVNANTIIAVGDGTVFMKSTNLGATWSIKNILPGNDSTSYYVPSIYAIDENTYAALLFYYYNNIAGNSYYVLKTTNGGNTWSKYFVNGSTSNYPLGDIKFTDIYNGWIYNTNDLKLYHTSNGGLNWENYIIAGNNYPLGAYFLNTSTGWVGEWIENKFFKTTNAGETWISYNSPDFFYAPFFINGNTGWLNAGIHKTTNGGANFFSNGTIPFSIKDYMFQDVNTGWAVFDNNGIYRTTNSGVSWQSSFNPSGGFYNLITGACFSGSSGFAFGVNGYMAVTSNNGANWNQLSTSLLHPYEELADIFFLNANTGWTLAEGYLSRTVDGGNSWTRIDSLGIFAKIKFANENMGILAYQGYFAKTTNSGANWYQYNYPGYNFTNISIASPNTWYVYGYAQSAQQILMKTTDAGNTWVQKSTSPHYTTGLYFLNENTGYITGEYGLYKTIDGGNNWSLLINRYFANVFFINENTGWTYSLGVSKTTDGGITWSPSYTSGRISINDFYFANPSTGWFCGVTDQRGIIMKTTDGGNSWKNNFNFNTEELRTLSFVDANTGWTAGYHGTILKTTTGGTINILQISTNVPNKFYLEQNYPNPFNPSTNIEFSLPQKSFVKLKVFDLLGREAANLVSENLSAGKYKYDFNASLLTSGIYFYKLETENFSETRKMILIK